MYIDVRFFADPALNVIAWMAVLWCVLVITFVATMGAKQIIKSGESIPMMFYIPLAIGGVIGLILDIVFLNCLLAPFIYNEWYPREWTFTARTQRFVDTERGRMNRRAIWWGTQLNKIDPRHIKGI